MHFAFPASPYFSRRMGCSSYWRSTTASASVRRCDSISWPISRQSIVSPQFSFDRQDSEGIKSCKRQNGNYSRRKRTTNGFRGHADGTWQLPFQCRGEIDLGVGRNDSQRLGREHRRALASRVPRSRSMRPKGVMPDESGCTRYKNRLL